MDIDKHYIPVKTSDTALGVEEKLAASLMKTKAIIAHAQCFDDEQRAEVYTILDALKSDCDAHRRIVGQWIPAAMTQAEQSANA
jgi:hypothetical protein